MRLERLAARPFAAVVTTLLFQPQWVTVASARLQGLWKDWPIFVNPVAALSWQ